MQYKAHDDEATPICSDCVHHIKQKHGGAFPYECTKLVSVIDGSFARCHEARASAEVCGPDGRWFEPIDRTPTETRITGDFENGHEPDSRH